MKEFFGNCASEEEYNRANERLIQKYGEEEAEKICHRAGMAGQVGAFWLCRDCIILDEDEFYEKLYPGYVANKKAKKTIDTPTSRQDHG
jgi:hypothetical protein